MSGVFERRSRGGARGAVMMALLLFAACGEATQGSVIGSCDTRARGDQALRGLCRTWSGEKTGDFEALCSTNGGTWSSGACSSSGSPGTCATDQGFGLFLTYTYDAALFNATTARTHCEALPSCTLSCKFNP